MQNWTVRSENDTGPGDDGYWEWFVITDGVKEFKCDDEDHAHWLCNLLNSHV